jgi:hypothetical protein
MAHDIDAIEARLGPVEDVAPEDFASAFGYDYSNTWAELAVEPGTYARRLLSGQGALGEYIEGQYLVTASWKQGYPYNIYCPEPGPDNDCDRDNCSVGCVGLAAAQITHYWKWPPYRLVPSVDFHWWDMPDSIDGNSDPAEISAVANLCYTVADVVETDFCSGGESGPCASAADVYDMEDAYPALRYDVPDVTWRYVFGSPPIPADTWFAMIQDEINDFRPIQYRIEGHSVVIDGWRIQGGIKQYHVNCGWANICPSDLVPDMCNPAVGSNTWYTLDDLLWSDWEDEYMVTFIVPEPSLYSILGFTSDDYPCDLAFPYRYFDDYQYTGDNAWFEAGQYLQCRADVNITCTGSAGEAITFYGSVAGNGATRLYNRGDTTRGIRVNEGAIAIYPNGTLHLYE